MNDTNNDTAKLKLLLSLALNSKLSKSEMNVVFYCWCEPRNSRDICKYLGWASPNVARLLFAMVNKGFLNRSLSSDGKTYSYVPNKGIFQ